MKILVSGGGGSIGKRHVRNLKSMGYTVRIYDPVTNWLFPCGTFRDAVKKSGATHVLLATNTWSDRFSQTLTVLEEGKELFVEKPFYANGPEGRYSVRDAGMLLEQATKSRKIIGVGYQFRSHPEVIKIQKRVDRQSDWVTATFNYTGDRRMWPGKFKTSLLEECSHSIDLPQFLLNGELQVEDVMEVENSRMKVIGTIGTCRVIININWDMEGSSSRHWFTITGPNPEDTEFFLYDGAREDDNRLLNEAYKAELQNWIDGKPSCTGADGLSVLRVIDAIRSKAVKVG